MKLDGELLRGVIRHGPARVNDRRHALAEESMSDAHRGLWRHTGFATRENHQPRVGKRSPFQFVDVQELRISRLKHERREERLLPVDYNVTGEVDDRE